MGPGRWGARLWRRCGRSMPARGFGTPFAGERIPTFAEVLERYQGRMHLHTEIKGRALHLASRTADLVRQYGMVAHVTVTSFQYPRLADIRAYAPELPTGWLVNEISDQTIAQARELRLTQSCPKADRVTPALVRRLHAEGFVVRASAVADDALMRQVVEAGADGMTVDFPESSWRMSRADHGSGEAYLRGPSRRMGTCFSAHPGVSAHRG
jgi:glycerophosphoryl diester phosphodiesterase